MRLKTYLLVAVPAFVVAVTGSDLVARTRIAGEPFGLALSEHLRWASLTVAGLILLFLPFLATAIICGIAGRRAATPLVTSLFVCGMSALVFFYYSGFQASQQALLDKNWTAAALSVGLLPFFVGVPLLVLVAVAASVIVLVDRRRAVMN